MNKWKSAAVVLAVFCLVALWLAYRDPDSPLIYAKIRPVNAQTNSTTPFTVTPGTIGLSEEGQTVALKTATIRFFMQTVIPKNLSVCLAEKGRSAPKLALNYGAFGDGGRRFFANYLHATGTTGGIGNQLFELVSVWGIARTLGRQPMILAVRKDVYEKVYKMAEHFPRFVSQFDFKHIPDAELKKVDFAKKCCVYESTEKLRFNDTFLFTTFTYLQSFKFFHNYSADVRQLLAFTETDIARAQCEVVGAEPVLSAKFRLCVHIRRGDYIKSKLHEHPREDFTAAAIEHVINNYANSSVSSPSAVILIGNDPDWSNSLLETLKIKNSHGYVTKTKPEDGWIDLAFVSIYCDAILLPASASSFGFWMAYLSKTGAKIFYNAKYSKPGGIEREFEPKDFFPPDWTALRFDNVTKVITEIKW